MLLVNDDIRALLSIRRDGDLTPAARATLLKIKETHDYPLSIKLRSVVEMLDNVTASLETILAVGTLIHMPEADRINRDKLAAEARQLVDQILRPQGYKADEPE